MEVKIRGSIPKRNSETEIKFSSKKEMSWVPGGDDRNGGESRGLLWKLPVVRTKDLGKLGPGFGIGAGCGVGFGVGLFGGAGLGAGFPGLQIGFGVGAGCGIGIGFGYGVGRGVAYDQYRKHSNAGKLFRGAGSLPSGSQLSSLLEDLAVFTEKQIVYARKQIVDTAQDLERKLGNWRRDD